MSSFINETLDHALSNVSHMKKTQRKEKTFTNEQDAKDIPNQVNNYFTRNTKKMNVQKQG